ncbi:hypothetical protein Clacol_008068 [Clathrus columnatus]|uniref:PSP1 C-terminal domain-containing protein n=1 Tax=Clathrus columnatus TaxID=1419009 RepID=A0AAV5ALK6_9AGAM|nr:hypothetical protein Clacol_008068 [Clathrus columnatus]
MQSQKQSEYRGHGQGQALYSGNTGSNGFNSGDGGGNQQPHRERSSSQPPRPIGEYSQFSETGAQAIQSSSRPHPASTSPSLSPTIRFTQAPPTSGSPSSGGMHNPWVSSQSHSHSRIPSFGRTTSQPGVSGSGAAGGTSYLSSLRDNLRFTSTFEDDEEALSDSYSFDDGSVNTGTNGGGGHRLYPQAQYGTDSARSRSQSLLVPPSPVSADFLRGWRDTPSGPTNVIGRQNASYSSSDFLTPATPTAIPGRSRTQTTDVSNISPFRRDIHQILMGDTPVSAVHSIGTVGGHHGRQGVLGTLGPPGAPSVLSHPGHRDDPLGGTSGTTSRRHSMSIYHPRRDIHVGFQTSDVSNAFEDAASSSTAALTPLFRTNVLSDEELASGLGGGNSGVGSITTGLSSLTMSNSAPGNAGMQSQPSSLPNFTHSRAGGLLGSPEHLRYFSNISPGPGSGASATGLSPRRSSVSPSFSRTNSNMATTTSARLDTSSDRAASVSPHSDVIGGSNSGTGGAGVGGSTAGMGIGMMHNSYGRLTSPETEYGGLSPPSGTGASTLGISTAPGPGRYVTNMMPPTSLSMYPAAPGRVGPAGLYTASQQQPRSPLSANFTPARFGQGHGHAHTPFGLASAGVGVPSINTAGSGAPQSSLGGNPTSPHSPNSDEFSDLGRGLPLHAVPPSYQLFIVEFKAGRTDLFYTTDRLFDIQMGDLVIVEADRGKDLGKVINDTITTADVEAYQRSQQAQQQQADMHFGGESGSGGSGPTSGKREINPKRIYGKAGTHETQLLAQKLQDEMKALQLCQTKVRAKKLPMEVVDAEYQWDRRKLTFYFIAEKRIDFRELVRELFRLYKTRIWMASLQAPQE